MANKPLSEVSRYVRNFLVIRQKWKFDQLNRYHATWSPSSILCKRQVVVFVGIFTSSLQCQKSGKIFTGMTYKLLSSFTVISDAYRTFIPNKTTFTKYCFTQWISKLPRSFEIHCVRQYLVNFMGLAGMVNVTVYKTEPIFKGLGHGKLSLFLTLSLCVSSSY